jgi:AcrR family transcriptional regulator
MSVLAANAPRFRRRKDARPAEIIEAALNVFLERGFAAARLDDIARRAGVTRGTLYLYFTDKEQILRAVIDTLVLPQVERAQAIARDCAASAADTLRALAANWVRLMATTRLTALPKLIIGEAGNFPDIAKLFLEQVVRRQLGALSGVLARGIETGEFRAVPVAETARLFIAPLLHAALWRHSLEPHEREPLDLERFVAAHLDMFLRGLRPEG